MAHTLAVLTVLGVILAGELARQAWGSLHYGACLGFWLAALVGTGLVTYNSVGRQAEASDTSTLSVEDRNGQRTEIKAQLAEHQRMLDEEQANKAAEIKRGGCGRVCQGFDASIAVYQSAVAGDEAKLAKLGPAEPVAPKAERFAEILALFGADKVQAKAVLSLLEPFLYTLLFEYGSIVAWDYAFRRRSAISSANIRPKQGGGRKVRRYLQGGGRGRFGHAPRPWGTVRLSGRAPRTVRRRQEHDVGLAQGVGGERFDSLSSPRWAPQSTRHGMTSGLGLWLGAFFCTTSCGTLTRPPSAATAQQSVGSCRRASPCRRSFRRRATFGVRGRRVSS